MALTMRTRWLTMPPRMESAGTVSGHHRSHHPAHDGTQHERAAATARAAP